MPDQSAQYEMKKHFAAHLVPLSLQSIHVKTMLYLLPMASMKPHLLVDQLAWAHELDVVVHLVEVHQDLQLTQGTSWVLSCCTVLLHHVGSVLHDECVDVLLVQRKWLSKHPHVLVQPPQMQRIHDQNLMLQKNNELVAVVGFVWQELMWSAVEHSLTCLFHLLAFLLCHHHPCLSCLSFLFMFLFSFSFSFSFLLEASILIKIVQIIIGPIARSSFDHQPNSLHRIFSILLLLANLLHNLHSPCESGLFFFLFLCLFLFLIWMWSTWQRQTQVNICT